MFHISLIVLLSVACLTGQSLAQTNASAIDQAVEKAQLFENSVRTAVKEKLPPTQSAAAAGEDLLGTLHTGLSHCETELRQSNQIPLYEKCLASLESITWLSLGEITKEEWAIYGATSGASRLGFLFW